MHAVTGAVRLTYAHDVKARKYLPKLVLAKTVRRLEGLGVQGL